MVRLTAWCAFVLLTATGGAQQGELQVVDLRGSAFERGKQHGTQLRTQIADMLAMWKSDLERTSRLPAATFVSRFLAATQFVEATKVHTPELLDEVRGIAAGAEQPFETMFVYQLIDEIWAQHGIVAQDKCSTIGVDRGGDQPSLVAQNIDIPPWMHRYPTVLRIRDADSGLQSLVVTLPGLVGANGVNNRRVAVCVNTILQLRPTPAGLPVAFVVRGLLAQRDHAAAVAFVRKVTHASGQAYTIGGPDTAACFEASASAVVPWQPKPHWTWHTNHPLASSDWSPSHLAASKRGGVAPETPLQCNRYDAIAALLPNDRRPSSDEVLQALRLHGKESPVCNPGTYVCTLFVLGEQPELRIAVGDPNRNPFRTLRFD